MTKRICLSIFLLVGACRCPCICPAPDMARAPDLSTPADLAQPQDMTPAPDASCIKCDAVINPCPALKLSCSPVLGCCVSTLP